MRPLCGVLAIGVVAAMVLAAPAVAEWPESGKREFTANCVPSCQNRAQALGHKCPAYCQCMIRELETAYPDPDGFIRLHQTQDPGYTQRVRDFAQMCLERELR